MSWRSNPQRWWLLALVLLVGVIAAGAAVFTIKYVSRPRAVEIAFASDESDSPAEVYVAGAVGREGIYIVSQDTTLGDILQRCEVLPADGSPLRLKVIVGPDEGSPAQTPDEEQGGKININSATVEELDSLSGIGPTKAQAIVDYRNQNGPFRSIDDLLNVPGIGAKTLDTIRDQITVIG